MAATRPLTVIDVYERFVKGKKVPESEWDYTIIPQNLTALKEKYKLKFEPGQSIPEDNETKNALFQAGLEMLSTVGFYCQDLGRVMHVTEEEIWEGIKKTPKKLILGEGRDIARFYLHPIAIDAFGDVGGMIALVVLIIAMILIIQTGYLGSSRALHSMAMEGNLPGWFGKLNGHGMPVNAMLFVSAFNSMLMLVLCVLPMAGIDTSVMTVLSASATASPIKKSGAAGLD